MYHEFDYLFSPKALAYDFMEKENNYELTLDVPGVLKEDIHMTLTDGYLNIATLKRAEPLLHQESKYGSSKKSFFVGKDYVEEDFNVTLDKGVLKVIFPKEKKVERKTIQIH